MFLTGLFSRLAANAHLVLLPALAGEDPNPQPSGTHGAVRPSAAWVRAGRVGGPAGRRVEH